MRSIRVQARNPRLGGATKKPPAAPAGFTKAAADELITESEGRQGPGSNIGHAEEHITAAGATDAEAKLLAQARPGKGNTTVFRLRRQAIQILRDILNAHAAEIDALPPDGVTTVAGAFDVRPESVPGFTSEKGNPATPVEIGRVTWRVARLPSGKLHLVHFAPKKI